MAQILGTSARPYHPLIGRSIESEGVENLRPLLMVYRPYIDDSKQAVGAENSSFLGFINDIISLDVDIPRVGVPTMKVTLPGEYYPLLEGEREIALCIVATGAQVLVPNSVHLSQGIAHGAAEIPNGRFYLRKLTYPYRLDGSSTVTLECTGILSRLQEAAIWHTTTEMSADASSPGRLLTRYSYPGPVFSKAIDACRFVGGSTTDNHEWGKDLAPTWQSAQSKDSGGYAWSDFPWANTENYSFQMTQTLYDIYEWAVTMDFVRFYFLNHHMYIFGNRVNWLDIYKMPATAYESQPVFRYDTCTGGETTTSYANMRTSIKVLGAGASRFNVLLTDLTTEQNQLRETTIESQQVTDQETANRLGDIHKLKYSQPERQVVRSWDLRVPGTPVPWVNYAVGDWGIVELPKGPYDPQDASTAVHQQEQMRIVKLSVHFDATGCSGTTTFGTVIDDVVEKLAKGQSTAQIGKLPSNVAMRVS